MIIGVLGNSCFCMGMLNKMNSDRYSQNFDSLNDVPSRGTLLLVPEISSLFSVDQLRLSSVGQLR